MARVRNDRLLTKCEYCVDGVYIEKSISDSMKDIVECDKCGSVRNRFKTKDKKVNTKIVATKLKKLLSESQGNWITEGRGFLGKDHILDMLDQMENQTVVGEKAHRWLGWAQAAIVGAGIGDLELMKNINLGK